MSECSLANRPTSDQLVRPLNQDKHSPDLNMTERIRAQVNPSLLLWARNRLGLDQALAARHLGVSRKQLTDWETEKKQPTVAQLFTLGEKYEVPPAVFYLTSPPEDDPLPHDFRYVTDAPRAVDVGLAKEIRRVQRSRLEAVDILKELGQRPAKLHISTKLSNDPEEIGTTLRHALGISLADQKTWKDSAAARKRWTEAVENLGVLVFASERISVQSFRGVSLAAEELPAILLNGQDSEAGRVFTLMHEMAHLVLHDNGICDPFEQPKVAKSPDARVERFCNKIAAAILMPRGSVVSEPELAVDRRVKGWPSELLTDLAKRYSVSRESMLLRLVDLGKATWEEYLTKREEYLREYEEYRKRRKGKPVRVPYKYRVLNRNGRAFMRLVLSALYEEKITTADLASLSRVNLKHMASVEEELFGRPMTFTHGA